MARNYSLDNAKFLLILLVVFGHVIEPFIAEDMAFEVMYLFIYSFHMPAFVMISGMLSKATLNEGTIKNLVKTILVPFIVFTVIYESVYFIENGYLSKYILGLQPYWILWFLLSLFIWRVLLPIVLKLKHPVIFLIMLSLLVGYFDSASQFLGISRTIYFFPFFVMGHIMTPDLLSNVKLNNIPKLALIALIAMNIAFFIYFHEMPKNWLLGTSFTAGDETQEWLVVLLRFILYCISFLTIIAVLLLVPEKKGFISQRGKNSLQIYVWHPLLIKLVTFTGLSQVIMGFSGPIALAIFFIISLAISIALSSEFIKSGTQRFLISPAIHIYTILRIIKN